MSIQQIGVRRVIITRPGPQGTNGGVASIFGRIGNVVADPGDYDELTDLTVTGEFNLTCEADDTVHRLRVDKVGSEYVLRLVSPLIALLFVFLTLSAHAATRDAVMVDTNGVLRYPTNIFAVNSNDLNSAVNRDSSLLSGTLPTNTIPAGIPWLAWSNLFSALQYFAEGLHIAPNKPFTFGGETRTNWPTVGSGGGSLTVAGDTGNPVSNLVNSATTSFARTNGNVAVEITQVPATTISGTIDILRLPSEVATDSEVAASMGALTNGTGSLTLSNLTITGTLSADSLTVPDDAYGAGWDGDTNVPTKNALYDKIETLGTGGSYDPWGNGSFDIVDELMASTSYGDSGVTIVNNAGLFSGDSVEQGRVAILRCRLDAEGDAPTIGFMKAANIFRFPTNGSGEMFLFSVVLKTSLQSSGGPVGDWIATAALQSYTAATNFPPTDFVGFVHCTNFLGSMNWGFQCVSNSTGPGIIDTGVAVTNDSWYELTVSVSETNAIGWINGVAVATNAVAATGIPIGKRGCAISRLIRTSTSVSSADYYYDRFRFKYYKP